MKSRLRGRWFLRAAVPSRAACHASRCFSAGVLGRGADEDDSKTASGHTPPGSEHDASKGGVVSTGGSIMHFVQIVKGFVSNPI